MVRFAFALGSVLTLGPALARAQEIAEVAPLPQAVSSFGAARCGEHVYVFGGHVGRAHEHSRENVSGRFLRLKTGSGGAAWEALPSGPAVQGTALVAHGDALFRIGGLAAHNEPGAPDELESLASVARFDVEKGAWVEETPLPEPRSSHDACVVGDRVFVAGGWNLQSASKSWLTSAWTARLDEQPLRWEPLAPPRAPRRACALASIGTSIALLGGMTEEGATSEVETLEVGSSAKIAEGAWSAAPAIPGAGFGMAAVAIDGTCFATSGDGKLWELDRAGGAWLDRGRLVFPRIFHRLLRWDDRHLIALGGADRSGHLTTAEILATNGTPCFQRYGVALPARIGVQRAGLAVDERGFAWIGGNLRAEAHRFAAEDFATAALRVSWTDLALEALPDLPVGLQSSVAWSASRGNALFALGGFGFRAGRPTSCDVAWGWDRERGAWAEISALRLPKPRTQGAAIEHEGSLWMFGGLDYDEARGEDAAFRARLEVERLDLAKLDAGVGDSGIRLPRARRAFAAARIGSRVYLIGGLGEGFDAVSEVDAFDLSSKTWTVGTAPAATRVSATAVALGSSLWLAGGTLEGGREARALEVFDAEAGWRVALPELPFPLKHGELVARGGALFFLRVDAAEAPRLVIHAYAPASSAGTPAFRHD